MTNPPTPAYFYNVAKGRAYRERSGTMRIITFFLMIVLASVAVYADGLQDLIEVGKSQQEIAKEIVEEEQNFAAASAALTSGAMRPGLTKDAVRVLCGEPVISLPVSDAGPETWVYKSPSTSWKGPRVYLMFDNLGNLASSKAVGVQDSLQP